MYTETEQEKQTRENNFTYHTPNPDQIPRFPLLRNKASELSELINTNCPPSRERSVAHTKLEEAIFWANAAIVRNEDTPKEPPLD